MTTSVRRQKQSLDSLIKADKAHHERSKKKPCGLCGYAPSGSANGYCRENGCNQLVSKVGVAEARHLRGVTRTDRARAAVRRVATRARTRRTSTTEARAADPKVTTAVMARAHGASEYSGRVPTWTKGGRGALTPHHAWPDLDGTGVVIAILFEEHAEVTWGDDRDALNEKMRQRLREIEPGGQPT